MKRFALYAVLIIGFLVAVPIFAKGQRSVGVPIDVTHDGNYYAAGDTVEIAGTVTSDVIVIGWNVIISGDVMGDVIAAGGNVRITGTVEGNIRAIGGNIELAGLVGRNVLVGAGTVILNKGSIILGHVTVGAGNLEVRGQVQKSLTAGAANVILIGEVQGPIDIWLDRNGELDVRSSAVTGNKFTYHAQRSATIAKGANLAQAPQQLPLRPIKHDSRRLSDLVTLFSLLVIALVVIGFVPKKVEEMMAEVVARPWQALGWGAAWAVLVPIVCIILMITLIGIPLAVLLLGIYFVGLLLSQALAGALVAAYLRHIPSFKQFATWSLLWQVVVGIVAYRLLATLPFLGGMVVLVGTLMAWGALVQVQKRTLT